MSALVAVAPAARADVPVGLGVGYAFRPPGSSTLPEPDDRLHGGAASVTIDAPPLLWGFSGRLEGLMLAFSGATENPDPLLLTGGAASFTYLFDDTAVSALASVGLAGVVVVDGADARMALGPLAGLTLRFPVTDGVSVDARVSVPLLADPAVPLAASATLGLSVAPDALFAAAMRGDGPAAIADDAGVPLVGGLDDDAP